MRIGYRTLKTAIGTPLAMVLAQLIGVTNIMSAGVLTILCIQPSRKKSFVTAWHRFIACLLSIIFSIIFFGLLCFTIFFLLLFLALFITSFFLINIVYRIIII